jgi:large subunit ribosomal protein L30
MSRLRLTQVRSVIDRPKDQKDTVRRLGLHRIHDSVVKDDRPEIRGMAEKVRHLVKIEELGSGAGDAGKDAKRPRPAGARKDAKRPGSGDEKA